MLRILQEGRKEEDKGIREKREREGGPGRVKRSKE